LTKPLGCYILLWQGETNDDPQLATSLKEGPEASSETTSNAPSKSKASSTQAQTDIIKMTHYDRLMDRISSEIYLFWEDGKKGFDWDEGLAEEKSYAILKLVEEFQQTRVDLKKTRWRASD